MRWVLTTPGSRTKTLHPFSIIESEGAHAVHAKPKVYSRRRPKRNVASQSSVTNDLSTQAFISAFERLQGLYEISDHDKAAAFLLHHCRNLVPCESGISMLLKAGNNELYTSAIYNTPAALWQQRGFSLFEGIIGYAVRNGYILARREPVAGQAYTDSTNELKTLICVPMMHEDKVLGVVQLFNSRRESGFTEFEAKLLCYLADAVALHIDTALPSREADFTEEDFKPTRRQNKRRISIVPPFFVKASGE